MEKRKRDDDDTQSSDEEKKYVSPHSSINIDSGSSSGEECAKVAIFDETYPKKRSKAEVEKASTSGSSPTKHYDYVTPTSKLGFHDDKNNKTASSSSAVSSPSKSFAKNEATETIVRPRDTQDLPLYLSGETSPPRVPLSLSNTSPSRAQSLPGETTPPRTLLLTNSTSPSRTFLGTRSLSLTGETSPQRTVRLPNRGSPRRIVLISRNINNPTRVMHEDTKSLPLSSTTSQSPVPFVSPSSFSPSIAVSQNVYSPTKRRRESPSTSRENPFASTVNQIFSSLDKEEGGNGSLGRNHSNLCDKLFAGIPNANEEAREQAQREEKNEEDEKDKKDDKGKKKIRDRCSAQ